MLCVLFIITNILARPGPLFSTSINANNLIIRPNVAKHYANVGIKFTSENMIPGCTP